MTMGRMANILAIQDKLIRLIVEENGQNRWIGTNSLLQEARADSLNWTDARLISFLESTIRGKFGVMLYKRNIKVTMNGSTPTIGDLAIAVFLAVDRQHKTGNVMLGHPASTGG